MCGDQLIRLGVIDCVHPAQGRTVVNPPTQRIRFAEFELDLRAGELRRGSRRIRLQEQPFQILLMLLQDPGEVVTREEICKRLWPDDTIVEFDHSIGTAIKKLRQALDDNAESPRYVETLPRRGFRFIFPDVVSFAGADAAPFPDPAAASAAAAVAPERLARKQRFPALILRHRLAFAAVLAGMVCVIALLAWHFRRRPAPPLFDEATLTQVTTSTGLDIDPSLSPDGSMVAYSSNENGSFEIYVKSLAVGGQEIQLTHDEEDNFEPAWSPDGKSIAYYARRRGGIWVMPALGGAARRLTDFGSWPAWSPDSAKIVFESQGLIDFGQGSFEAMPPSTLWVVPAQGGAPTQLTRPGNPIGGHGAPSWSPDGRHIAFSSTSTSFGGIWSVPAAGGEPRRLVKEDSFAPVYGPDGRYLYYSQGWEPSFKLMRVALSPDGAAIGEPTLVQDTGQMLWRRLSFSSDGKLLAFSGLLAANNLQSLRVSPATGAAIGGPIALTHDTNGRKTTPLFSPDGAQIAYSVLRLGTRFEFWVMDADGGNAHPLSIAPGNEKIPGWLSGGKQLAFLVYRESQTLLESLDLSSGKIDVLRTFAKNDAPIRLSPDGKRAAYGALQAGAVNLWTAPLDGGPARQLTFGSTLMSFPCWSPDGKFLAFEMRREGGDDVAVIPSGGGTPVQLTNDPGPSFASDWSPDGDKIVFAGLRNGVWNIWWVSRRTREEKQLTRYTKENEYVRYPTWSPRGDQIAYEYAETTGNIWTMRVK